MATGSCMFAAVLDSGELAAEVRRRAERLRAAGVVAFARALADLK